MRYARRERRGKEKERGREEIGGVGEGIEEGRRRGQERR